ncbi:hypothetical protein BKA63DRAFT_573637 [Paraphoma chrysanthemicola]|nr:hypothetical protein BKA63DRAFT_573637 [Paraphoma chrysanthemicola]
MSHRQDHQDRRITIDPKGDSVLTLFFPNHRIEYFISSIIMRRWSLYFNAILTHNFRESVSSDDGKIQFSVPNSNLPALHLVLQTLHCHVDRVPGKVDIDCRVVINVLEDYYDIQNATLKSFVDAWFERLGEEKLTSDRTVEPLWKWYSLH